MSLYNRRMVIGAGLAALAGCGFTPVYDTENKSALRGQVRFATPKTRTDFVLRNALEDRIGTPASPQYELTVTTTIEQEGIAITRDQVTTRFNIVGRADYALRDLSSDSIVTSGTVNSFTSYSATGTTVATQTAERAATDRLMTILADQITTRLLAHAA